MDLLKADSKEFPVCPYCKKELKTIKYKQEGLGLFGKERVYFCPSCKCVLGIGLSQVR